MYCFSEFNGKVFAIRNWRNRVSEDDAMIASALDTQQVHVYHDLKDAGQKEPAIIKALFPPKIDSTPTKTSSRKITMPIDHLDKRQVMYMIKKKLGSDLPSLVKMTLSDLRKMLSSI